MKWKTVLKTLAALLLGFVILDLFCTWYYNPAAYIWDDARATDTVRVPGVHTSRATEGFAQARVDAYGYNNPAIPGEDGVSVLLMGSSHAEGFNVLQPETMSVQLEQRLEGAGMEGGVYNIGTSAHTLMRNVANFERALERFSPSGYVVLETQHVKFNKWDVEAAMDDSFERLPWTRPVISEWVSERPLLRTLYRQWENLLGMGAEEDVPAPVTREQLDQYQAAMTDLMFKLKETALAHGVQPIICYHPHLLIGEDGSAAPDADPGCHEAFRAACDAAGVCFVDMTERFLEEYALNHVLPHGFANTAPGTGHLNPVGHALVAEALCAQILEMEAAK